MDSSLKSYGDSLNELPPDSEKTYSLYAAQIHHTLYIMLYGNFDLLVMLNDMQWIGSKNFLVACDHAMAAAEVTAQIMEIDPFFENLPALFGTYLLQSAFVFIILAQKLGSFVDQQIMRVCGINLRAMSVFGQLARVDYQIAFALIMGEILESCRKGERLDIHNHTALKKFRWIPGFTGLVDFPPLG